MTRILPGVYVTLNDYSTLPEGTTNLTVGYVLQANRGPVNKCELVTSPSDFLAKYTFSGAPKITDDPTFWSVLQVLGQTNTVYISRACKNAKFGGLLIKKETEIGTIKSTSKPTAGATNGGIIMLEGAVTVEEGIIVRITGKADLKGRFKVADVDQLTGQGTKLTLAVADTATGQWTNMPADYEAATGDEVKLIQVNAPVVTSAIADPEAYVETNFTSTNQSDLMLITGIDPGAYNNDIAISITSYSESPEELSEADMMIISVSRYNESTNTYDPLESWMCNRKPDGKTFDGTVAYVNEVTKSSAYIRAYSNPYVSGSILPSDCSHARLGGGSNGDALTSAEDLTGALELFADKTVPVSILGNGTGALYENPTYQTKLIKIAKDRGDCVAFVNSRYNEDERATVNSTKANNIIAYKKGNLGTDWHSTMYAPHVNYSDSYNSRQVRLGADSTAIEGWLSVMLSKGMPYAYAGPTNGLVTGVTTNWKIGDTSKEAELLNDASVNYIAYDAKVGRYYMQTQNTLQIANSSLRNLGAVFNVLDIKETLATYLKEYLQRPITDALRSEILLQIVNQMNTIKSNGRVIDYSVVDGTTTTDLADNTLRYSLGLQLTPYAQKIYLTMNIIAANMEFSISQG